MSNKEEAGAQLRVQHTGQVFPIEKAELGIGRQEDNAIILADPRVSAYHAVIYWRAETGAFFIEDLESKGGTYVNGIRLEAPRMLRDGDSIRLGNTVMELTLPPAPGATLVGTL
ncbi:MAG: FHA domain-containing protein, partial [Anaerolineae bacterium]